MVSMFVFTSEIGYSNKILILFYETIIYLYLTTANQLEYRNQMLVLNYKNK